MMGQEREVSCYFSGIDEDQSGRHDRYKRSQQTKDFLEEYSEEQDNGRTREFNCKVKFEAEVGASH
jgi:uncharacterized Fe-S cluster-containing MiaB family protein